MFQDLNILETFCLLGIVIYPSLSSTLLQTKSSTDISFTD
jgi:hypothetical protein